MVKRELANSLAKMNMSESERKVAKAFFMEMDDTRARLGVINKDITSTERMLRDVKQMSIPESGKAVRGLLNDINSSKGKALKLHMEYRTSYAELRTFIRTGEFPTTMNGRARYAKHVSLDGCNSPSCSVA
ncbi:MAG: hypothetical protein ACREBH_01000 [Candidatus Micrarchaeaceae archaeon]